MSKTRKNMLRSSLVMLVVAAIALSSATFAWFTAGSTAKVETLEFKATASKGLQISADALEFKSTLTAADIENTNNFWPATLKPLSTTGEFATTTSTVPGMNLYEASVDNDKMATALATAGYYEFDLYFKNVGNTEQDVYLDLESSTGKSSVTDTTKTTSGYEKTGLANAARVAFVDRGDSDKFDVLTASADTTGASAVSCLKGKSVKIWEPNATTHGNYALTYRYEVDSTGSTTSTKVTSSKAYPYVGIKAAESITTSSGTTTGGLTVTHEAAAVTADKAVVLNANDGTSSNTSILWQTDSKNIKIATIPANQIGKVTVYVWLEGQDVDCNNKESGGTINLNLCFNGSDSTTSSKAE